MKHMIGIFCALTLSVSTLANVLNVNAKPEKKFINMMVKRHHFKRKNLTTLMQHAQFIPEVIERMNKPYEAKPWNIYRDFFVKPERIKLGVQYWNKHAKILANVAKRYGVDPSVIVAIIGVESHYGVHAGTFPELSTLATLAFKYPKRNPFFRRELTQYLLLTRQDKLDALKLTGSYAGALGIPQFMPSSYRYYGVDYLKNHHVDLLHSHDDAIASVANYLRKAGWRRNQPVAVTASLNNHSGKRFLTKKIQPKRTLRLWKKYGITTNAKINPNTKAALVEFKKTNGTEYWLAFRNFRALMNYNPSPLYAMAVYQLSQKIMQARESELKLLHAKTQSSKG